MSKIPKNVKTPCIIYTLSHPDTKEIRYVGKTIKKLKHRLTSHLYSIKRENNHRTNWINSIIKQNKIPIIEEIEICPWDESQNIETYWISQCKCWGFRLINLTDGGEGCIGRKLSAETIKAITKANGKKVYQYDLDGNFIKEWLSSSEAARCLNKSNSKICACARGERGKAYNFLWSYKKVSNLPKYERQKCIISEKERLNRKVRNSIPVLQYDSDNNFIKEWESAKVAAKELGLCYTCIIMYLNGNRINHRTKDKLGDFIWKRK